MISKVEINSLLKLFLRKFLLRALWVAFIATFGIHLLFTCLPPKQVNDTRTNFSENYVLKSWTTSDYIDWVDSFLSATPKISDAVLSQWLVDDFFLRINNTFWLCSFAFLCSACIGVCSGIIKSHIHTELIFGKPGKWFSIFSEVLNYLIFFFSSIPAYMIAFFLFLMFNSSSNLLLAIIALALGSGMTMDIARFTNHIHHQHLHSKYVENALICGLKTQGIIPVPGTVGWHAFRNSLITILPIIAYRFPLIVSSALVVEVVFDLPGLGESLLVSLIRQDVPMILTIVLISVVFVQLCVGLAEIMVFILQPQVSK